MIKTRIKKIFSEALIKSKLDLNGLTVIPQNNENFGDYSTSISLQLAKVEKANPMILAEKIAKNISTDDLVEKVEVIKPGFINVWIAKKQLLKNLTKIDNKYGNSTLAKREKVIVEYSSPNIAKPFTIGHLRSTIIGDAIANILEATGAKVYRDNHLGDWGTQFGKLIYAIKTWGNENEIKDADNPVRILVDLYVRFHKEAEINPQLNDEGRMWFKKLEEGDAEARRLWTQSIEWSWNEFDRLYKKLGIKTEKFENNGRGYGESYFEDKMSPIIDELKKKEILTESKGAFLVFFPNDKYPPLMLIKQDGATLYATRDLATDAFRLNRYGKNVKIINEVGAEQSLYFQQLYETEVLAGWLKREKRVHIKHGMYRFKDSKMSTRKGNTIWLEDVLKEATNRAIKLGKLENIKVSEVIGVGALKWNDLKKSSHLDIVFDWEDVLNMQGNSGPYIQYTYVRCRSVLNKVDKYDFTTEIEETVNLNNDELVLIRSLLKYPETVLEAAKAYAPNYLCTYLYDLSQKYNLFYQKNPILKAEDTEQKNLRLKITLAVSNVLQHGLNLLGIKTVKKM